MASAPLPTVIPAGPIGRLWAKAVERNPVAKVLDGWWYNTDDGAVDLVCTLGEIACIAGVPFLLHMPLVIAANIGRNWVTLPKMHSVATFVRTGRRGDWNFDIVNRPQTFHRDENGHLVQSEKADEVRRHRTPLQGTPLQRTTQFTKRTASDLVTQRRKMPGFIAGSLSPVLAILMNTALHAPTAAVWTVTYGVLGLQVAPMVISGGRAAGHIATHVRTEGWAKAFKDGYQVFARPEEHAGDGDVTGMEGPLSIAQAEEQTRPSPSPATPTVLPIDVTESGAHLRRIACCSEPHHPRPVCVGLSLLVSVPHVVKGRVGSAHLVLHHHDSSSSALGRSGGMTGPYKAPPAPGSHAAVRDEVS